jgi:hypothetical protein
MTILQSLHVMFPSIVTKDQVGQIKLWEKQKIELGFWYLPPLSIIFQNRGGFQKVKGCQSF